MLGVNLCQNPFLSQVQLLCSNQTCLLCFLVSRWSFNLFFQFLVSVLPVHIKSCPAKYFPCCHADNKPNSSKDSFHLVSMVQHFWLSFLSRMKTSNLIYKSDFFVETEICFAKKKKTAENTMFFFAFKVYLLIRSQNV